MQRYDFARFLERMAALDFLEIISEAEREANRVDDSTRKVPGAVKNRAEGAREYVEQIGAFLFFMKSGQRPHGAKKEDFQGYRVVVDALVKKGQFKGEALRWFK